MNGKPLTGKVALVTGASRGLGKAIVLKFASLGARVGINYVSNDTEAAKVLEQIRQSGGEGLLLKADVGSSDAVKGMVRQVVQQWSKIDILVNNAGIVKDMLIARMSEDNWDQVMNTNLRGAFLCTKFAMRPMMEQNWGRIINISSLAGIVGNQGQANYSAAKGGLIAFTKSVARELGSRNITANAIAPGFIVTEMTDNLPQETRDFILTRIPLRSFGSPEDIAALAAYLASEEAGYITAQVISVDGGVI